MPIHKVSQGECLLSIANKYGFSKWEEIYDHPDNSEFKAKRSDPHCIFPGDKVFIPEKKAAKHATGKEYKFKIPTNKAFFSIILTDTDEEPLSGIKYELEIYPKGQPNKKPIALNGQTDGAGKIEQEIPILAEEGTLTIWPFKDNAEKTETWIVKIGHLDPQEEIAGVQERLLNQGYACGPLSKEFNGFIKGAINDFQDSHKKDITEEIDDKTRKDLAKDEKSE